MVNKPSKPAVRAALAIINSTVNPALRHDASNVIAPRLAEIIERETSMTALLDAVNTMVEKADGLISAIGIDQFPVEAAALTQATTAAWKILRKITEAQRGKQPGPPHPRAIPTRKTGPKQTL